MIVTKFEEITRQVWHNIHYADMYQTLYGEETITDSILLELVKARNFHICILQTPKSQEPIKGTNWEWFVDFYRFGWIRYAVQAPHFKDLFHDKELIGNTGDFFGESFKKIAKLPEQFINALELGILDEFPEELFRPDVEIVPKRLAIITLDDEELFF